MLRFRIEPGTALSTKVFLADGDNEIDVTSTVCRAATEYGHPAVYLTLLAVCEDSIQPDRPVVTKAVIEGASLYDEFTIEAGATA